MSAAMQVQVGTMSSQRLMPELGEQQFAHWAVLLEQRLGITVTSQPEGLESMKMKDTLAYRRIKD